MKTITTFLTTVFTFMLTISLNAQTFEMVEDINPSGNSSPNYFTEYNGSLYFVADDGTSAGTIKIQPAIAPNSNPLRSTISHFTEFDDSLYFSAHYNSNGRELWKITTPNVSTAEVTQGVLKVYPNPVNDILHIETEQEITEIKLYTLTGQEVQTWKNQDNIDLSGYVKGVYLMKIQTPNGTETKEIIKE